MFWVRRQCLKTSLCFGCSSTGCDKGNVSDLLSVHKAAWNLQTFDVTAFADIISWKQTKIRYCSVWSDTGFFASSAGQVEKNCAMERFRVPPVFGMALWMARGSGTRKGWRYQRKWCINAQTIASFGKPLRTVAALGSVKSRLLKSLS